MYAMKCLDKKRIKMKQGETLALNERIMLSLVSTGVRDFFSFVKNDVFAFNRGNDDTTWHNKALSSQVDCPFIVCMTYAFHTADKLCFILDLMNGGDLHYHLNQHGVFNEPEVKFYAAEMILGLEHMHRRYIVYRDLKPANILLDEHGHGLTTAMLAQQLQGWRGQARNVAFLIGGPDGLDDSLKRDAHARMRLSSLTLPHPMVRVLLAEQLYRAWSILAGHPYHRA